MEYFSYLRDEHNYAADIAHNNPSETGIKCRTMLNDLPSFHCMDNLSVDPMHDLFCGGVVIFGLEEVLSYCIFRMKFVSLEKCNAHKHEFAKRVPHEALKRMPDLGYTYCNETRSKRVTIRATASETKAFIRLFTLLMGPFVPETDKVWKYLKMLVKLVEKVLAPELSTTDLNELNQLVTEHHAMYIELFEINLKPKHHFLLHYSTVAQQNGILRKMMNYRFEAMHKIFKEYAHVISSRSNICLTLCIKAALKFSNDLNESNFFKSIFYGKFVETDLIDRSYMQINFIAFAI